MNLKASLSKSLKWFANHLFGAILGLSLALLFAAWSTLFWSSAKDILNYAIQLLNTPTPLWATISLALLCALCMYLKGKQYFQKKFPYHPPKEELISVGSFKWNVTHKDGHVLKIDGLPYCLEHKCSFIPRDSNWVCPIDDCKSTVNKYDLDNIRIKAESIIENLIRTKKC